ncbi:DNA replication/repair protein RecF [Tissierella praeacuta]|uniref:DNA replication and repair protein RecF n=1 Tax=Tissierella praeacuta DSM 18095 TaxID=1123404 RepID=A0A1M4Z0G1_9FIRM|nr:DNA replication/repair protein RecF [Tissierella praeacuta]MBU5257164.1 DNA replication/repair protein RecF [Tissierella praeacuta]SHF11455.1 DNA replication and repair protein RecF [Tissierella praeacuta DSM 18095]SUO98825.1 DNA replication and repair protein recF [Tissierella praeacuta]
MYVKNIRLINFRNYLSLNIELNKKVNIFIGKNAQGKTNLLEAIYICATGRSFRTNRDKEIINFNKNEAYIGTQMNIERYEKFIEVKLEREKTKRIRVNKQELKNHKELYSGLNIVIFSPDDLKLIKGGPGERRNFLDMEISQIKPVYNFNINRYNKILFQRNNLLRTNKFQSNINNLLEIFDLQLAKIGTDIILERDRYIKELSKISNITHNKLTLCNEELQLNYLSNIEILDNKMEMEKRYLDKLKKYIQKDIEASSTQLGPHRDDILMTINNKDIKTYGSQGQQRTVVLSIKLAEVELIKGQRGVYPILLLDDVFSELDEERRKYLIKSFQDMQTLITVTDAIDLKEMETIEKSIFYIEDGKLKEMGVMI